ncbi:MAG TPA: SRPBCC family protein [Ohtaekwangia sp.]|nr:SRPBCC family protein [Ohtaekwangia sp.]
MKSLRIVGIAVLLIAVIVVVFSLAQPGQGHVARSIVIDAPPATVFEVLADLKNFPAWSPWVAMDPEARYTYEGPASGVGAKMHWNGKALGKGSQWIEESVPGQRIKSVMDFREMNGFFYSIYTLEPDSSGVKVTWTYDGENKGFTGKMRWLFMKGGLSTQFEDGLKDLKRLIEKGELPLTSATTTSQQ